MTRLAREAVANPRVQVYHADVELTREVVDDAAGGPVREVAGVARVSANRYRMRIHLRPGATFAEVLPAADAAALAWLGARALEACPPDDDRRDFALASPAPRKIVVEGVVAAGAHPLAAALFRLDGVAEVILDGARATVRKGRLHGWSALEPSIRAALRAH